MDSNEDEFLKGLGSSVPSLDLNRLITEHGLNNWPAGLRSNEVVHTSSLNLAGESRTTAAAVAENKSPTVTVLIENRMVRFRYDSELNNRNFGKEVLAKILVYDFIGKVKVRIHAVDDKRHKAHPFCLIGDKCYDGVYIEEHEVTAEKNECICKATPRIPKQKDYEEELKKRKAVIFDANRFPFITPDMNKDDYWTANKNIKESKEIILVVEVLCSNQNISNQAGYSVQYSEPINNAKDGKKFEVYAIAPASSSVQGSPHDPHYIILTADSYSPNESDVEVRFSDDGNWASSVHAKVIKNAIEFNFPGYSEPLSVEKTVYVCVYDKKRKIETSKKPLILRPTDGDIIAHKRKKAMNFADIYNVEVKREEPSSCQRRIHHLKKNRGSSSAASSPLDLAKLEEEGMLSLNICSPLTHNDSTTSSQQSDYKDHLASLNGTIPSTIPALLVPSGSSDMSSSTTLIGSHISAGHQSQSAINNVAITKSDWLTQGATSCGNIQSSSAGVFTTSDSTSVNTGTDIAQEQTISLGSMAQLQEVVKILGLNSDGSQNPAQYQEILRLLGLNPDGQLPQTSTSTTSNFSQYTQNQYSTSRYDPHDIQLEDLVDDLGQSDIEVDCAEISSTTYTKESCEKCQDEKEKSGQKTEKEVKSEKATKQDCKKDIKKSDIKTELQSDIITSNVKSDVEEG